MEQNFSFETKGIDLGTVRETTSSSAAELLLAELLESEFVFTDSGHRFNIHSKKTCCNCFKEVMCCLSQQPIPSLKLDKTTLRYSECNVVSKEKQDT